MTCAHAHDATIAGQIHVVLCTLPSSHTGAHRMTTEAGALIAWPNEDHCQATTAARGREERCRLGERHGSPHMTEDGAHLWLDGTDTVLTEREKGREEFTPHWRTQFDILQYGGGLPIRLGDIIDTPEKPAETRTEKAVARTYKQRKKGKKR